MTAIGSSLIGVSTGNLLNGFEVDTLSLAVAGTEYTYNFPAGTKAFAFKNRDDGVLYLRKTSMSAEYWTFFPGQPYFPINISSTATISVILSSNKNSQTVEIIYWS